MTEPEQTQPDDVDLAVAAVEAWGRDAQLAQAQEELAELIVALSHYRRARKGSRAEVLTELLDVDMMLSQIGFACAFTVEEINATKAERDARLHDRLLRHTQHVGGGA